MAILESWYFNTNHKGRIYLEGRVEGHERIPDGMFIHTTALLSLNREGEMLKVKTRNTEYVLPIGAVNLRKHAMLEINEKENSENLIYYAKLFGLLATNMQRIQQLDEIGQIDLSTLLEGQPLPMVEESRIIADLKSVMEEKYKRLEALSKQADIGEHELWLEVGSSTPHLFRMGLAKYQGNECLIEEASVHLGMFQDSVLIRESEGIYDIRYFTRKDGFDIYKWDGCIKKIKIYNSGEQAVSVTWGCKRIQVLPHTAQWMLYES